VLVIHVTSIRGGYGQASALVGYPYGGYYIRVTENLVKHPMTGSREGARRGGMGKDKFWNVLGFEEKFIWIGATRSTGVFVKNRPIS